MNKYTCENGNLIIPEGVESIQAEEFISQSKIVSVHLPNSIRKIGKKAFSFCAALSEISVPEGVERIEEATFEHDAKLATISLPDTLTYIGKKAFFYCAGLKEIRLPKNLKEIASGAFKDCYHMKEIILPDSVTKVAKDAFDSCWDLRYNEYENAYYLGSEKSPYRIFFKLKKSCDGFAFHPNVEVIADGV